jgi:hypothetical protein
VPSPAEIASAVLAAFADWLSRQPEDVRDVARDFPPGSEVDLQGTQTFVVGYDRLDDGRVFVALSPVSPDGGRASRNISDLTRTSVCPHCLWGRRHLCVGDVWKHARS